MEEPGSSSNIKPTSSPPNLEEPSCSTLEHPDDDPPTLDEPNSPPKDDPEFDAIALLNAVRPPPRRTYTFEQKLEAIDYAKTHSRNATARKFGFDRKVFL
jgi:hypothetical protein